MTRLTLAALSLLLALAAASLVRAEEPAKALDTYLPDVGGDDLAKRAAACKALEALILDAARPGADAERAAFAKAIAAKVGPGLPQFTRVWLVKELQHIGRAEVVPALTALLADPDALVRETARRALQYNPAPDALAALKAALDKATDPAWTIALLNAVADRRDLAAVPAFTRRLADKDESVVAAALDGLGRIGGPEAAKAVAAARGSVPAKLRPTATDAWLRTADALLAAGQADAAAGIYQTLYAPAEPANIRVAGLRGLVRARGAQAIPLLAEILKGQDEHMRAIALSFVQEIPSADAIKALAALVPQLPPAGQAALVAELGRRGDPAARPAVLDAAKSKDEAVRTAALRAMATLGSAAEVPLLAQSAASDQAAEADAARAALSLLPDKAAGAAIADLLARSPDAKVRAELARALAARRAPEAAPALTKAATDADAAVRAAALGGLEALGDEKVLPLLITLLKKPQADADVPAIEKALLAVCGRAADKAAATQAVTGALAGSAMPARGILLRALGRLGGTQALGPVRAALADADAQVKEAAVRSLADWPDGSASADLLGLAKTETRANLQVLALRGYVRLIGVGDRPVPERLKMCQDALAAARRPDEKRLVLGALGDVNAPAALLMATPMMDEDPLKEEAAQAAAKIAKALGNDLPPGTKAMMEKVLAVSKNNRTRRDAEDVLRKAKN